MLIKFYSNKGQNTAEYALLIALVVAGIIAMQTYAQRSLQARMRGANTYLANQTSNTIATDGTTQRVLGQMAQYEPYYLKSSYNVERTDLESKILAKGTTAASKTSTRTRKDDGFQTSTYNQTVEGADTDGVVSGI